MKLLFWPALLVLALPGTSSGAALELGRRAGTRAPRWNSGAALEVEAATVLKFGPRVAGSPANEQARQYFEAQFRALGYQTRREAFTYPRFDDLGSEVRAGGQVRRGYALQPSLGAEVTGAAVRLPGVGSAADYFGLDVRGNITSR